MYKTILILDLEIKLTPTKLNIHQPMKGLGYSFSSNSQKLKEGRLTKFAVGVVSGIDDSDAPSVVILESRPTIEIIPSSQPAKDNNIANDNGKSYRDRHISLTISFFYHESRSIFGCDP